MATRGVAGLLGCTLVACGASNELRRDGDVGQDAARGDAARACDIAKPFGSPSPITSVNSQHDDRYGWLTPDGLSLYFSSNPTGGQRFDLYVATRSDTQAEFSPPNLLAISTANTENRPILTADGLMLLLEFVNNASNADIQIATRADSDAAFSSHVPLAVVNTTDNEFNPWISEDGLTLYFTSDRDGFNDIYKSTRASRSDDFSAPTAVSQLNSSFGDYMGALSRDGLEIFFASSRDTNLANSDIFHAVRATPDATFGPPRNVTELSDPSIIDYPSWISPDRCELIFTASQDIWLAKRPL